MARFAVRAASFLVFGRMGVCFFILFCPRLYNYFGLGEGQVVRVPESYIDTTNRRGKSRATTFIVQFQLSLKRNCLQAEDFYKVTPQTPQLTKTIYEQYLFYKGCVCFHAVSKRTVRNWQVQHRSGSIHYRRQHGTVQIQIAGFYYVYSQMYYYDGMAYQMTHQLYVNSRKFMQSTSAVISEEKKYSTNYNGGVVFLNSTDYISVRTPFSRVYKMDPGYSYFGAFLLHPTTN